MNLLNNRKYLVNDEICNQIKEDYGSVALDYENEMNLNENMKFQQI